MHKNVKNFLFGSKSQFNDLCHKIVNQLRGKYTHKKRIAYTCKGETVILENEKTKLETQCLLVSHKKINLLCVDREVEYKTKYTAGKASYIERNKAMIDKSDYCIFYYDLDYTPKYNTKSGTKLAYEYAIKKNKKCINILDI